MLVLKQLLIGVVLPALLAALFLALSALSRKKLDEIHWATPLAICAGYLGAHLAIDGLPDLVPLDDMQWLVHLTIAAAFLSLVEVFAPPRESLTWLLRALLAAVSFWLLLGFMVENYWTTTEAVFWLGTLTALTLAITATFEALADHHPGAAAPLAMVVLGAGSAVVLVLIGSAKVAQLTGGLTAAAAVLWLFSTGRHPNIGHGTATAFSLLFVALLAFGYLSAVDVPAPAEVSASPQTLAVALVATAPLLLWVARLGAFDDLPGWLRATSFALVLAVPLGAAAYLAANPPEQPRQEETLEGVDYDALYQ